MIEHYVYFWTLLAMKMYFLGVAISFESISYITTDHKHQQQVTDNMVKSTS